MEALFGAVDHQRESGTIRYDPQNFNFLLQLSSSHFDGLQLLAQGLSLHFGAKFRAPCSRNEGGHFQNAWSEYLQNVEFTVLDLLDTCYQQLMLVNLYVSI